MSSQPKPEILHTRLPAHFTEQPEMNQIPFVEEKFAINIKSGLEQYGTEKSLEAMITYFDEESFHQSLSQMIKNLMDENWAEVQHFAHNLKSTSG